MPQPGAVDQSEPRRESVASRLPWRYGAPGRRQFAAIATARLRSSGGAAGTKTAGARGGYDIDDHIRMAVREESAASLGRAGGKLQSAVAALAELDQAERPVDPPARKALLQRAALALWEYVVQREAMGLTNHELVNQVYVVTAELWRCMGSADCFTASAAREEA